MLTIRLARTGRKKLAHYKVVAADSRRATTGKFVAQLGHYDPHTKQLTLDDELTQQYLDSGAQPSSRVVKLLDGYKGIKLPEWAKKNMVVKASKPKKATPEETGEAKAEEADSATEKEELEASGQDEEKAEADQKPEEEASKDEDESEKEAK